MTKAPESLGANSHTDMLGAPTLLNMSRAASLEEGSSTSLSASVFAALGAEAWINHLIWMATKFWSMRELPEVEALGHFVSVFGLSDRFASTRAKYDAVGLAFARRPWTWGATPFQDYGLVIDIRNTLVHHRPETTPVGVYQDDEGGLSVRQDEHSNVAERLFALRVVDRPRPEEITPLLAVLSDPKVGQWSYRAVCRVIAAVVDVCPESHRGECGADVITQLNDAR